MIILKYIFLAVAIMFTFTNILRGFRGQNVSGMNVIIMSVAIAGYMMIEFGFNY